MTMISAGSFDLVSADEVYSDVYGKVEFNFAYWLGHDDPYPRIITFLNETGGSGTGTESDPFIIQWCRFVAPDGGLWLQHLPYYFIIRNCKFEGTEPNRIWFYNSSVIEIYDCEFISRVELTDLDNVTLRDSEFIDIGFSVNNCRNASFINNTLTGETSQIFIGFSEHIYFGLNRMNNTGTSLVLAAPVTHSIFENNTILNAYSGMQISAVNYSVFRFNTIINISLYGICLHGEPSCVGNEFYGNIIENVGLDPPEDFMPANDYSAGILFTGYSSGNNITWNTFDGNAEAVVDNSGNYYDANYWSDYDGTDDDGDNFGDIPFNVTGTSSSQDHRPRMERDLAYYDLTADPSNEQANDEMLILIIFSISIVSCVAVVLIVRLIRKSG